MTGRTSTPEIGDAFGATQRNVLDGGDGWHVVERDDGFVEPMAVTGYLLELDDWDEGDAAAIDMATGRVLDVGAGAGRHTLELQRRGCEVVALDTSVGVVDVCVERGIRQAFLGIVHVLAEAQPEPFDAVVKLGNNISLLGSEVAPWPSRGAVSIDPARRHCDRHDLRSLHLR